MNQEIYKPSRPVRVVTAASLFDGHDVAINLMRRILQSSGAEVVHLGHNRSAGEIVSCAIQEDAQAIAVTSYQGGHMEFFRYLIELLRERQASHIKVFGGGGGTILPEEIRQLQASGVSRVYSPDDGRKMGLQGMINDILASCDAPPCSLSFPGNETLPALTPSEHVLLAKLISLAENDPAELGPVLERYRAQYAGRTCPVVGITGTGGAGKSSLTDELLRRFLEDFPDKHICILSVDPSRRKTGGALLGDRIRMNSAYDPRVYMRSMATRGAHLSLSKAVEQALDLCKLAGFDLILLESSGIGQSDTRIVEYADLSLYVMTPEFGAATQLEKIDMLDFADLVAINKFDKRGAGDALRDVQRQYRQNQGLWESEYENMPVYGTIASRFNDPGVNRLYLALLEALERKSGLPFPPSLPRELGNSPAPRILSPERSSYLAEIAGNHQEYERWVEAQCSIARKLYQLHGAISQLEEAGTPAGALPEQYEKLQSQLDARCRALLESWADIRQQYSGSELVYKVREQEIRQSLLSRSLSGLELPRIALPSFQCWGDLLRWLLRENLPGHFPYTSGVFPLKRGDEDPTRMFAGEGGPERTNKRFHYLAAGQAAQRLSTAFDSVTLYGEDPGFRPDIYGKIGNSGVSVASLDDCKKLYSGFDLCKPSTSVSMTINGPAPMLLAFFLNAAIDQQCEKYILMHGLKEETEEKIRRYFAEKGVEAPRYEGALPAGNEGLGLMLLGLSGDKVLPAEIYERIRRDTLGRVRGTVQADILKEDQAQNTCIFSTEFALGLMGDIQEYFIREGVRNFYSVSVSGYHIAEAGANPVTQLAFTLANSFTYVEYYLSRGMHIDEFAPNFSFFFSNGLDPEYSVIGRVARRIWAKAIRFRYKGNERSQKLKYHIQTSGRSLHAQEIDFNDIRTTLQALYAYYDHCNSLHTNAYDEAITTPTEESVRRALAIQLIIQRELGLARNENPLQGSFIIERLSDLVEEAVYEEFRRLSERGGVLGAMELMYQRGKIQDESLLYEKLKHQGKYPIIGVNTFLNKEGSPTRPPREISRASESEKQAQINSLESFRARNCEEAERALQTLKAALREGRNSFEVLMEAGKVCSLGQLSGALYEIGGQYRRNM